MYCTTDDELIAAEVENAARAINKLAKLDRNQAQDDAMSAARHVLATYSSTVATYIVERRDEDGWQMVWVTTRQPFARARLLVEEAHGGAPCRIVEAA